MDEEIDWKNIKAEVFATIMDFFTSGLPVVNEGIKNKSDSTGNHSLQFLKQPVESFRVLSTFISIRWK